jgi:hypothetical protein
MLKVFSGISDSTFYSPPRWKRSPRRVRIAYTTRSLIELFARLETLKDYEKTGRSVYYKALSD